MSKIGITEVKRIAALAHIGLTDDQVAAMAIELREIVNFVEKLSEVDASKVEPTDQVTGLVDVLRKDEIKVCEIDQNNLLQNAPDRDGAYIKVRRVL